MLTERLYISLSNIGQNPGPPAPSFAGDFLVLPQTRSSGKVGSACSGSAPQMCDVPAVHMGLSSSPSIFTSCASHTEILGEEHTTVPKKADASL